MTHVRVVTIWLMLCCVGLGLAAYVVGCPHHVWFWAALFILVFPGLPLWLGRPYTGARIETACRSASARDCSSPLHRGAD
mgnify:CR=1 FL=1